MVKEEHTYQNKPANRDMAQPNQRQISYIKKSKLYGQNRLGKDSNNISSRKSAYTISTLVCKRPLVDLIPRTYDAYDASVMQSVYISKKCVWTRGNVITGNTLY